MTHADSPLLAPDRVAALRALGGPDCPELVGEVARLFIEGAEEALAELRVALPGRDASAVKTAAHRLRGSCGNVGATALAELCLEAELAAEAREVDPGQLAQFEGDVAAAIEAVRQTFRAAA